MCAQQCTHVSLFNNSFRKIYKLNTARVCVQFISKNQFSVRIANNRKYENFRPLT